MTIGLTCKYSDVSQGLSLFSDGNLEKGVELFEEQHTCNQYCTWFGLSSFSEAGSM
ncbi:hypothetical protein JVT61DRAFT_11043 [Boletus reticuloceps]|uniref:Alpha-type protein kinase domain-containing protein n=1 Tax=Boletus reticuloceps TaxID=495285 RepID=A0A8I3A4I8_9AGAM|nr:hypothetical protein JVT61DRAFT_11043 [Boletus reticuloceps]